MYQKMKSMLIFFLVFLSITACSSEGEKESVPETKKAESETIDLSGTPIVGKWTLHSVIMDGQKHSLAEWINSGEISSSDVYDFR